jgi:hypothetical protein
MSQTQLAKALGISQPAVAQLVKKGMPTDSVEAAKNWRATHVGHRRTGRKSQSAIPVGLIPSGDPPPDLVVSDQLRNIAIEDFKNATTIQDRAAASRMVKDTEEAHETRKRDLVRSEQEAGNLMHRDQVQSIITEEVGKVRSLLEAMPGAVAQAANPADPDLSQGAIADYLEQVFSTLSNTGNALRLDTR